MPKPLRPLFSRRGIEIYHGDSLEILPRLRRKFDLVLSDPPYAFKSVSGGGFRSKLYDDPKFKILCQFDPAPFLRAAGARQQRLNLVATCSRDLVPQYARLALERGCGFDLHVWHKPNAVPFINRTFKSDLEYVVLLYQSPRPWNAGFPQRTYSKLFTHATLRSGKLHPTQKPRELMAKYLRILCPPGGLVLDPYAGSGTTLVEAQAQGLRAVGIEHDLTYCRRAIARLKEGE